MLRYVTYKRVSTKEQGRSGLGLEAQERDIAIFLETYPKEPWEIVGEFVDVHSGSENERPEFAKAVSLAKREKAILLVSKLDRLSRRVSFISTLMEDKQLQFRVASMPDAKEFELHIYAALAEQERRFISQRTIAALKEAKARGQKLGGLRDKTMRRNRVWMAQADERARKLEAIVLPLKEQGASLRQIANALNEADIMSARGGTWHAATVRRLLGRLAA